MYVIKFYHLKVGKKKFYLTTPKNDKDVKFYNAKEKSVRLRAILSFQSVVYNCNNSSIPLSEMPPSSVVFPDLCNNSAHRAKIQFQNLLFKPAKYQAQLSFFFGENGSRWMVINRHFVFFNEGEG